MGFPTDFFPVLFTIPRIAGWLSHWNEFLDDKDNKIVRPRQIYTGYTKREYVPIDQRQQIIDPQLGSRMSKFAIRRNVAYKHQETNQK